ncbi:MAG: glutaredoxin family protein [Firmicutes bacterium]|nr:glutaredoxin family protein [Bacillota bacterium]
MEKITVYTSPSCPWCSRVKSYLNEKGVSYREVDINTDYESAKQLIELTGQRAVPVITKGSDYVVGYNPQELERIIR